MNYILVHTIFDFICSTLLIYDLHLFTSFHVSLSFAQIVELYYIRMYICICIYTI